MKYIGFGTGNYLRNVYPKLSRRYEFAFFIDNDSKKWGSDFEGITIKSPKEISSYDPDEIIVVIFSMYVDEITEQLKNAGVKNIVSAEDCLLPLSLNIFLMDSYMTTNAIKEYFYKSDGDIGYFNTLIQSIKETRFENENFISVIQRKAEKLLNYNLTDPESRLVLLRILYDAECFNADLLKAYMKNVGEIKGNPLQKFWLINDTNRMWFLYPNVLYRDFFSDRQNLIRDYIEEISLDWDPPNYHGIGNKNICVIVQDLFPNCVTDILSARLRELQRRGYSLHIIDVHQTYDCGANFLKPKYIRRGSGCFLYDDIKPYFPDSNLYYLSANIMRDRQQEMLDLICKINPCCIIDVSEETAFASYHYSKDYPTVVLPIRKGITGASSLFFHKILLGQNFSKIQGDKILPPVKNDQIYLLPDYQKYVPPKGIFNRTDYGFCDNDVIVITVGNRLQYDLSEGFIACVCEMLSQEPNIKWLCVGCKEIHYFQKYYPKLVGSQVFMFEYEDDLPGLYGICDIYLNPPHRIGGGLSITWAMQQGMALASTLSSEAGIWFAGIELALKTGEELVSYVRAMANDPKLLEHNKKSMLEKVSSWNINKYIDSLVACIDELVREFSV